MQVWINGESDVNVVKIARVLDQEIEAAKPKLFKAFILYMIKKNADSNAVKARLEKLADGNKLKDVALLYIRDTDGALDDYKISKSPEVKNTVIVYVKHQVKANFVNLDGDQASTSLRSAADSILK